MTEGAVGGVMTPNIDKLLQDWLGRGTVELSLQLMSRSHCWEVAGMICSLLPQAKGNGIPISYTLGNRTNPQFVFPPLPLYQYHCNSARGTGVCTTFRRKLWGVGNLSVVVVVHETPAALVTREI